MSLRNYIREADAMTDEHETIEREFNADEMKARTRVLIIAALFLAVVLAFCWKEVRGATTAVREGGTADFACCEDASCTKPIGPQYARDWAAKDACEALVEADGKIRYFRQWPMRVEKSGVTTTCPPKPADETQTAQCPAGTTGSWQQTQSYGSVPPPTCWVPSGFIPSTPPSGACTTPPPPTTTALQFATSIGGTYAALAGASVSGSLNVRLSGTCPEPAGPWDFYLDGVKRNSEAACPYELDGDNALFDTRALANGSHTLEARGPSTVSATFAVNNPLGVPVVTATSAPNATNPTTRIDVTLSWAAVPSATSYDVERCDTANCTNFVAVSGSPTTAATLKNTNIPATITYSYRVRASNAAGKGAYSTTVKVAPAPPPGTGSAQLQWTAPTTNTDGSPLTNLAGYRIWYGTASDQLFQTIDVNSPGLSSYIVGGLASGTWYFAVASVNAAGAESANSNLVSKAVP